MKTRRQVLPVLLWLAVRLPSTAALSAHSPQDLFAYPQYQVVLDENGILNETVPLLLSKAREDAASNPADSPAVHVLRTPAGQAFLCTVPVSHNSPPPPPTADDVAQRVAERERGLERGLALLDSMKGGCLYQKQGYFTYSFCYGSEIRQFHEVRLAGSLGPSEDPNADSYTLGQSPAPVASTNAPKYSSGSGLVTQGEPRISASLGGGNDAGFGWDDGGRYLSQKWEGGTICDKTLLPRSVEVQFHCNTNAGDRIALIRETAICTYVMLIHTPRLCSEAIFLEGTQGSGDPPSIIQCKPIVKKLREAVDPPAASPPSSEPESPAVVSEGEPPVAPDVIPATTAEEAATPSPPSTNPPTSSSSDEHHPAGEDPYEVDTTMITLLFDPDTGVIHGAESADGEELFFDSEEGDLLERFDLGHGHHHDHDHEGDERDEEKNDIAAIQNLQDLAKIMQDSIVQALRQHAERRDHRPLDNVGDQPAGAGLENLDALIASINRGIKRASSGASGGDDNNIEGYLKKLGDKVAAGVDRKQAGALDQLASELQREIEGDNARLAKGFHMRYEQEEEEGEGKEEGKKEEKEEEEGKEEEKGSNRGVPVRDEL